MPSGCGSLSDWVNRDDLAEKSLRKSAYRAAEIDFEIERRLPGLACAQPADVDEPAPPCRLPVGHDLQIEGDAGEGKLAAQKFASIGIMSLVLPVGGA